MATPTTEQILEQEIKPAEQESKMSRTRAAIKKIGEVCTGIGEVCTGKEYTKFRRLTAAYTVGGLALVYGLFNNQEIVESYQANDSVAEKTISDAAFRATSSRLNIHCDADTARDHYVEKIFAPSIVKLSHESCENLMAMGSGEVDSDKLVATQSALRLVAKASVMQRDILGARTQGEVNCVTTQYYGRLAEEQGLTHTAALDLQAAEVAGYDKLAAESFKAYAIPETCGPEGPLDARIPGALLPPLGSVR